MPLFGPVHLTLLAAVAIIAAILIWIARSKPRARKPLRLIAGCVLALNELIWYGFRYSQEGFRFPNNLPLQLCDITVWTTVAACLTLAPLIVEFDYFAGIAGAGMALLTPNLWSPWPSYGAIYFFIAHGGVVAGIAMLVFGRIAPLRTGAIWRAFILLLGYAGLVGAFDAIFKTNYMFLCEKPAAASLLSVLGPWPVYLASAAAVGFVLYWLLWLPVRPARRRT